jgi:hypothetical protein
MMKATMRPTTPNIGGKSAVFIIVTSSVLLLFSIQLNRSLATRLHHCLFASGTHWRRVSDLPTGGFERRDGADTSWNFD